MLAYTDFAWIFLQILIWRNGLRRSMPRWAAFDCPEHESTERQGFIRVDEDSIALSVGKKIEK